jgi:hypothetical protein
MVSYDQIRKMGEIQKSLKKHGLVTDSEEALKEAESIIVNSDENNIYVSKDKMTKMQVEPKKEENVEDMKKMESKINERFNDVDSQLDIIREKMNEIIAKMNELESKVNAQPKHEVQATLSRKEEAEEPRQKSAPAAAKKEVPKQRPGQEAEYSMADVAVDKIFYVGK